MSVNALSPIVLTISNITSTEDALKNEVIESVIRVFFPTMENLKATIATIQKDPPAQLKVYRQTGDDMMAVAKTAIWSIGTEGTKQIVAKTSGYPSEISDHPPQEEEIEPPLYPVIIAMSGLIRKKSGEVPVVEARLRLILAGEDNVIPTEQRLLKEKPKPELQTHFHCDKTNVNNVVDFLIKASASTEFILPAVSDSYFS